LDCSAHHIRALVSFSPSNPSVAGNWNNLGIAWANKGNYDKAIGYFEKTLGDYVRRIANNHLYTREMQLNLTKATEMRAARKS
jgi:serine/threonine-protein kinase